MWAKVNEVTGKQRRAMPTEGGLDAAVLNAHYAATSTDLMYTVPQLKSTCSHSITWPTERTVFNALDNLKNTATGMDGLPAWYLKLGAPVFALPLSILFNLSLKESTVPQQFKMTCITPGPKTTQATVCADFRPIFITHVLSRVFEKMMTRTVLYPMLKSPEVAYTPFQINTLSDLQVVGYYIGADVNFKRTIRSF